MPQWLKIAQSTSQGGVTLAGVSERVRPERLKVSLQPDHQGCYFCPHPS